MLVEHSTGPSPLSPLSAPRRVNSLRGGQLGGGHMSSNTGRSGRVSPNSNRPYGQISPIRSRPLGQASSPLRPRPTDGQNSPVRSRPGDQSPNGNRTNNQNNAISSSSSGSSRRVVSMDSAAYHSFLASQQKSTVGGGARAVSATEPSLMNRLEFENIDLLNTPLSSLRSCSEYNKVNASPSRENSEEKAKSKSVFGSLFSWGGKSKQDKVKNKVRFRDSKEDQVFMIESLRFNEANLFEGEDYNYHGRSRSRDEEITQIPSIHSKAKHYTASSSRDPTDRDHRDSRGGGGKGKRRKHRGSSFIRESSAAFDYVFGYGPRNKHMPMEIELRDLRAPQLLNVYHHDDLDGVEERLSTTHLLQEEALGLLGIRRVTSLGSFQRLRAESSDSQRTSIMSHSSAHSGGFMFATLDLYQPRSYLPYLRDRMVIFTADFRHFYSTHIRSRNDELFYECIRIQPFASGSYLRGMLSAGFCSMTFNVYNIMSWPALPELSLYSSVFEYAVYSIVVVQLLLNLLQLPSRLRINSLCWDSSRVVEVDEAINFIRTMLHSDAWIFNRTLGLALDVLALLMLVLCEAYLWTAPSSDLLRPQIVSLCATSLLTLLIRVLVATVFGMSMHDPEVLSNARRRGLSKWDLDVLPSFVYSCSEDVNNADCCICLGCFELGEMLTCLPCDKKHSFHAGCIRSWLERQNSCPLCQKMV